MDFCKRTTPVLFYKLESESSPLSNDDTESVYSFQDVETDLARDTSDTEHQLSESEYELSIEYEVDSGSGSNSDINTSDESEVEKHIVLAAAAAICDSSFEKWVTDGEDSDMSSSDNSFERKDFWTCIKCKSQNTNPLVRYCNKCFQEKKTMFPPRPRHRKPKKSKEPEIPVHLDNLRSCLNGLSSVDSGIGSSQECPPLDLDKIIIPDHLQKNSPSSSNTLDDGSDEDIIPSSQQFLPSTSKPTLNDLVKNTSNRKRQISESSLSDFDVKKPKWKDVRKSPNRKRNSDSDSPSRKRKFVSSDQELPTKKSKLTENSTSPTSHLATNHEDFSISEKNNIQDDNNCKTSDLGSEISSSSGSGILDKAEDSNELCIFCNVTPRNAIFLHGNTGHMCCCYNCGKRTWLTIKRCPICNRKVNNVVKIFKT